jgi:hypothetical protein
MKVLRFLLEIMVIDPALKMNETPVTVPGCVWRENLCGLLPIT